MSTPELKAELTKLIENETDAEVLQAILTIMQKTSLDPVLKEKLTSRALRAEDDILAGRIFSKEEALKRTSR